MVVTRYHSPSSDAVRFREAVDRWFGEPFLRSFATTQRGTGSFSLPVDVFATDTDVYVIASAPGLGADDLDVTFDDNTLTLSGSIPNIAKSIEGESATWFVHEIGHGQFKRTISLAVDVDAENAEATFENGILRLRLPKLEAARPRQIKVQSITSSQPTGELAETAAS
jgi:HSP20 family protein